MEMSPTELHLMLGDIDIYLLDQILKGQFQPSMKILDAGCGSGRNLKYFQNNNFDVYGIDIQESSINAVRETSNKISPLADISKFQVASIDNIPYSTRFFDAIICSAVLHFASDLQHFSAMVKEMWRVLKYGGFFFARLASDIGIEELVKPVGNGRFHLPDGSTRFLVNEKMLLEITEELNGIFMEPIKTVNVQNSRCMTNWIISKVI